MTESGPVTIETDVTRRSGPLRIVTFGDAALDVIVALSRPAVPDDDVPATIALTPGGQAANVAIWSAHLGADAAVIANVGNDSTGLFVRSMLVRGGVTLRSAGTAGTSGVIAAIVEPGGMRTLASDRGDCALIDASQIDEAWFADVSWLHLSGYALFGNGSNEAARIAAGFARDAGANVSVDLSTAVLVESLGASEVARRIAEVGASLVFENAAEREAAGDLDVATTVEKRGAQGCVVRSGDRTTAYPATPVADVRDTTGAGDAFAAGWLVGGVQLALQAAARCVSELGAGPVAARRLSS